MNRYSLTDVTVLNKMIDFKNPLVVESTAGITIMMHINDDGTLSYYDDKSLKSTPPEMIIKTFLRLLKPNHGRASLNKLIFEEPLKNVPLYLNKDNCARIFAQWRLKIGK